jgi:hypothetical protein
MSEFLHYWLHNAQVGWEVGNGAFEWIERIAILVSAGCLCHRKFFKHRSTLEDHIMKAAFYIFALAFVISTVFVAPFIQHNNAVGLSNQVGELTGVTNTLQKKLDADEIVISKTATSPINVTVTNITLSQVLDTNTDELRKQLKNAEAILYGERTYERFFISDTNRTIVYIPPNEGPFVFFKLKHAAIKSSVEIMQVGPQTQTVLLVNGVYTNLVVTRYSNTNQFSDGSTFLVTYLADDSNTNLIKTVRIWNAKLVIDNSWLILKDININE